jgi:hypothetical protein
MCDHRERDYRVKIYSDGSIHIVEQCLLCFDELTQSLPHDAFRGEWLYPLAKPAELFGISAQDKIKIPEVGYNETQHTRRMKEERKAFANYRCEFTLPGGYRCPRTTGLESHHTTYERRGHELLEDFICLCRDHHRHRFHDFEPD